jgi:branched-chain amino acid transport system substrate-binding protein
MKSTMKLTVAVAVLAMTVAGAQAQNAKVGAVLSVTGPAAFLGDPEHKTLQMLVEQTNAAGGLLGKKLELVSYDDGSEAGQGQRLRQAPS